MFNPEILVKDPAQYHSYHRQIENKKRKQSLFYSTIMRHITKMEDLD